jgi:hypothetical protein
MRASDFQARTAVLTLNQYLRTKSGWGHHCDNSLIVRNTRDPLARVNRE